MKTIVKLKEIGFFENYSTEEIHLNLSKFNDKSYIWLKLLKKEMNKVIYFSPEFPKKNDTVFLRLVKKFCTVSSSFPLLFEEDNSLLDAYYHKLNYHKNDQKESLVLDQCGNEISEEFYTTLQALIKSKDGSKSFYRLMSVGEVDCSYERVYIFLSLKEKKVLESLLECKFDGCNFDDYFLDKNNALALKGKDFEKAEIAFSNMISNYPEHYFAYFERGQIREIYRKDFEGALNDYHKVIELQPKCLIAYKARGDVYKKSNKIKKAYIDYSILISTGYANSDAFVKRAALEWGSLKDKVCDYTNAIRLRPNDWQLYNLRGIILFNQKNYDSAEKDFLHSIKLTSNCQNYLNLGLLYTRVKKNKKALKFYNKAIKLDPEFALAYNNRGYLHRNMENYEKAMKDIKKAIKLDEDNGIAYASMAEVYYDLGKKSKFFKYLKKSLQKGVSIKIFDGELIQKYKQDKTFLKLKDKFNF